VYYLEEENAAVRSEAAVAVSQLLVRICVNPTRSTSPILLAEVLERLLILGTSDPDPLIRRTVLENLDPRLDTYLADADNLRYENPLEMSRLSLINSVFDVLGQCFLL